MEHTIDFEQSQHHLLKSTLMKNNFTLQFWSLTMAFSLTQLACFGQWEVLTSGTFANVSLDDIDASSSEYNFELQLNNFNYQTSLLKAN